MNLAWAGGQVVGGGASGALADLTSDAVPYALLAPLCLITLAAGARANASGRRRARPRRAWRPQAGQGLMPWAR